MTYVWQNEGVLKVRLKDIDKELSLVNSSNLYEDFHWDTENLCEVILNIVNEEINENKNNKSFMKIDYKFTYDAIKKSISEPYNDEYKAHIEEAVKKLIDKVNDGDNFVILKIDYESDVVQFTFCLKEEYKKVLSLPRMKLGGCTIIYEQTPMFTPGERMAGYTSNYGFGTNRREWEKGSLYEYFPHHPDTVKDFNDLESEMYNWCIDNISEEINEMICVQLSEEKIE